MVHLWALTLSSRPRDRAAVDVSLAQAILATVKPSSSSYQAARTAGRRLARHAVRFKIGDVAGANLGGCHETSWGPILAHLGRSRHFSQEPHDS